MYRHSRNLLTCSIYNNLSNVPSGLSYNCRITGGKRDHTIICISRMESEALPEEKINSTSGARSLFSDSLTTACQMATVEYELRNGLAIHVPEITGCPSSETLPRVIASTWLTEWLIVDEWRFTILGSDTLLYTSNSDLDWKGTMGCQPVNGNVPFLRFYVLPNDQDTVIFPMILLFLFYDFTTKMVYLDCHIPFNADWKFANKYLIISANVSQVYRTAFELIILSRRNENVEY